MRTIRLLLAAATAIVALSAAIGTASARRIESSEQRFRQIWRELLFRSEGGTTFWNCPVTLEGSFHSRTLSKVSGQLIGYITHATVGTCAAGAVTALTATLPWHVLFVSFTGVLPRIETVTQSLIGAAYQIRSSLGITCLTQITAARPFLGIVNLNRETGQVTTLNPDSSVLIPNRPECTFAPNGRFSGVSEVFAGASGTNRLTIRLVQ